MSSRSVPRGSAAARSIRLALRASSIVATSRPSLARWVFRCRGNLATKSAMPPSLTCSPPPPPPLHPARSSVGSTAASVTQGQTDGWQAQHRGSREEPELNSPAKRSGLGSRQAHTFQELEEVAVRRKEHGRVRRNDRLVGLHRPGEL